MEGIVYISSICWNYSWHREQEMMKYFADKSIKVLFVEPSNNNKNIKRLFEVDKLTANLYVLRVWGVPYERCLHISNHINSQISKIAIKLVCKKINLLNPTIWMDRIHGFDFKYFMSKHKAVYDLIDEITAFGRYRNAKMLKRLEKSVFINSDIVISSSQTLKRRKIKEYKEREVYFIPNGIDYKRFEASNKRKIKYFGKNKPVIGFVGSISRRSIDINLINEIASTRKDCNFVLVGPGAETMYKLFKYENIYCIPQVKNEMLPSIIQEFDIGFIPYNLDENSMDYVFPRKLCEYLACGKPVISTCLKELQLLDNADKMVNFIKDVKDLDECITNLLAVDNELSCELKEVAQTYDNKGLFDQLIKIIQG